MRYAFLFLLAFVSALQAEMPPQVVVMGPVTSGPLVQHITAVGTFTPYNDVVLKAELEGPIREVHFKDGDIVKEGQPLITLHNKEQQAKLAKAKASHALSKTALERQKKLLEKKFGSQQSTDEARAQHQGDDAEVTLAQENLRKTKIVAPFDGVLSGRQIAKGSYVQPGDELVRIQDIASIRLIFHLPQKEIPAIQVGAPLKATTDVYPDKIFEGKIEAIDASVNEDTHSVMVYATFPNEDRHLIPGLYGQVQFPSSLSKKETSLRIPEHALLIRQDGTYVYKFVKGKAVLTPVTLGARAADYAEVLSGLQKGETIVLEGHDKIKDGDAITGAEKT